MRIFADTADIDEINEALDSGVIDGVTTNPSLIKKAQEKHKSEDIKDYIKNILKVMGDLPVSLEVTETSFEGMKREAFLLKKHFGGYKNMVVKIPVNPAMTLEKKDSFESFKLIRLLTSKGIDVNTTVVMTPEQAVLAAKAGAKFVSPFAGRIDDFIREAYMKEHRGKDFDKGDYFPAEGVRDKSGRVISDNGIASGTELIRQTVKIFDRYGFDCDVLAASARNARQVREFMLAGADIATMPLSVLKEMTSHYKTVEGIMNFKRDTVPEYKELLTEQKKFSISLKKE